MMCASMQTGPAATFRASMPERYGRAFDDTSIDEHAAIVGRRGERPVHVEVWRQLPRAVSAVCVVADDRPGLLSFISASLVAHQLDVMSAQAYTRRRADGTAEAVDLLWLRRDAGSEHAMPLREADVARVADLLEQLLAGVVSIESVVREARSTRMVPPGATTRVTFDDGGGEDLLVLTVETFDRPGLLLAITRALYKANVQIIASDAVTRAGRVIDRFTVCEVDGTPIRQGRRWLVQMEVLGAIDALSRGQ